MDLERKKASWIVSWALNPMTDIPQGDLTDKSGQDNVTREKEIGRMHASPGMLEATRSRKRQRLELPSESLEVTWLC